MERITVDIHSDGSARPTEILADLRNVAETLFHPMMLVGYWDGQEGGRHICPQADRNEDCPHLLDEEDPSYVPYTTTMDLEMNGRMEVYFPHADVSIYLGQGATLVDALRRKKDSPK